jgi:hypothetical protein
VFSHCFARQCHQFRASEEECQRSAGVMQCRINQILRHAAHACRCTEDLRDARRELIAVQRLAASELSLDELRLGPE